jgi:hypothetical protein
MEDPNDHFLLLGCLRYLGLVSWDFLK